MGKLIRNGIEYGGGNGTDIFEVDQDTYDELKQAGTLVHNALYVISDAPNLNATASDIEYSSGVTVKQAIELTDISSSLTMDANYFSASTKQVYKSGNVVNICLRGNVTATNGTILGTIATYYPKANRIICDFHNNGAPTPITTGAVWLNGENGRMYYFGSSVTNLDVCITVTFIANVY